MWPPLFSIFQLYSLLLCYACFSWRNGSSLSILRPLQSFLEVICLWMMTFFIKVSPKSLFYPPVWPFIELMLLLSLYSGRYHFDGMRLCWTDGWVRVTHNKDSTFPSCCRDGKLWWRAQEQLCCAASSSEQWWFLVSHIGCSSKKAWCRLADILSIFPFSWFHH